MNLLDGRFRVAMKTMPNKIRGGILSQMDSFGHNTCGGVINTVFGSLEMPPRVEVECPTFIQRVRFQLSAL